MHHDLSEDESGGIEICKLCETSQVLRHDNFLDTSLRNWLVICNLCLVLRTLLASGMNVQREYIPVRNHLLRAWHIHDLCWVLENANRKSQNCEAINRNSIKTLRLELFWKKVGNLCLYFISFIDTGTVRINRILPLDRKEPVDIVQSMPRALWPLLLTWFNFNPSMDK